MQIVSWLCSSRVARVHSSGRRESHGTSKNGLLNYWLVPLGSHLWIPGNSKKKKKYREKCKVLHCAKLLQVSSPFLAVYTEVEPKIMNVYFISLKRTHR